MFSQSTANHTILSKVIAGLPTGSVPPPLTILPGTGVAMVSSCDVLDIDSLSLFKFQYPSGFSFYKLTLMVLIIKIEVIILETSMI